MTATATTIDARTGVACLPRSFPLAWGGALVDAQVAFELDGPDNAPVVVVLGGISSGRRLRSWWPSIVGPGLAIDTTEVRALGIDPLGGVGASTAISTPAGPRPVIAPTDQAAAIAHVLDAIGVERCAAVVGASFGAAVALAFAASFPQRLERLVAIAAAGHSRPLATAWRSVQRGVLELGRRCGAEAEALALARALAMTTYRSDRELALRFDRAPGADETGAPRWPVEDYLSARGTRFASAFDVDAYLCLSRQLDLHRVDAEDIRVPTALISFAGDQLVPPAQVREFAARLRTCTRCVELDVRTGHDAFLAEPERLAPVLTEVLR